MAVSQVLIIIVIAYGSLLNLLAKPWSSTDSLLERRRNDLVAVVLWTVLTIVAVFTVREGIVAQHREHAFDLQDWTALVLPFALAAPYLLELCATLIRQLEMWRWMRRATIQALPIAWMYRTMTVGERDSDADWLRGQSWAPWSHTTPQRTSFWNSTTRDATLHRLFRRWLEVLLSALRHSTRSAQTAAQRGRTRRCVEHALLVVLISLLVACTSVALAISILEWGLMLLFDFAWWQRCVHRHVIVARYDTVHFGRTEMQVVLDLSSEVLTALSPTPGANLNSVHNRIMGAVMTTAAVLENAFRRAYLCTPVYSVPISNRKVLRDRYAEVGCDLDRLIKQVRVLLEGKHTAGLISIASTGGTIEASLHDNIECILSVCMFYQPSQLYAITARIAQHENAVEQRLSKTLGETTTRERVVYIDARNAVLWLLWTVVTRDWIQRGDVWQGDLHDRENNATASVDDSADTDDEDCKRYGERWVEALYVTATFLSRCRYCARFGMGAKSEAGLYAEVRALTRTSLQRDYAVRVFHDLNDALLKARGMDLVQWVSREYGLEIGIVGTHENGATMNVEWSDDTGTRHQSECGVILD